MTSDTQKPIDELLRENISATTAADTAKQKCHAVAALAAMADAVDAIEPKVDPTDDVPAEKQLFSLGYCCQLFQCAPNVVREIAKRAGVSIAMVMNDIPHYDGVGVVQMNRYLRELRESAKQ